MARPGEVSRRVVQGNGRIVHLVGSLLIGDQAYHHLFQQAYEGQEHEGDADIEESMEVGDAALSMGSSQKEKGEMDWMV